MAVVKVTYIQGVILCSLLTQQAVMLGLRPTCFANQISELGVTSRPTYQHSTCTYVRKLTWTAPSGQQLENCACSCGQLKDKHQGHLLSKIYTTGLKV